MPNKRAKKNAQQYLPAIVQQPTGMPPPSVIKTEVLRMGLSAEDAEAIIDFWLANGFMTGRHKVYSWTAVLRTWKREHWFPSQKKGARDAAAKTDWSKYQ